MQLNGTAIALPARVFECLCCLIEHRDRAVSRNELLQAAFGRTDVSDTQFAQVILRTRRAIGDDGQSQHAIRTVPRFGFRWVAEVTEERLDTGSSPAAALADAAPAAPAAPLAPAAPIAKVSLQAELLSPTTRANLPAPADRTRRSFYLGVAVVALGILVVFFVIYRLSTVRTNTVSAASAERLSRAVMVLPTEVVGRGDESWARLGLMDFIGEQLRGSGLPVLPSETVLGVMREASSQQKPDELQRVRSALRARWIVTSRASRSAEGSRWLVALVATDGTGLTQRSAARHDDLLGAARLAANQLSAALGGQLAPIQKDTPGLTERLQRARAAMLANEIETARHILITAPKQQLAQPRLRYQLARVDFRAGEYARGLASVDAVLAGQQARGDVQFHLQLLNARGAMLIRLDRIPDALANYDEAVKLAGDGTHAEELGQALSGRAVVYSMQQQFDRALVDFGQARVQLAAAGDTLAVTRVDSNIGILELDRGRPAYALPYLAKAADDFGALGAVNELATVLNARVLALLQLLRTDEAIAASRKAQPLLARMRDPLQRTDLVLTQAAVAIRTGQLREAGRLLETPDAAQPLPAEFGRREYLQALLAMQSGTARNAMALADTALRQWPPDRNPRQRAWLRLLREQAALAADLGVADVPMASLGSSLPDRLTLATLQRAHGDEADADANYRAALALAEQRGVPAEIAAVVVAHAGWLLERGRNAEAGALVGRVASWAEHDFDLAVLHVRLLRALGQQAQWRVAFDHARALAGERTIPAALRPGASAPVADESRPGSP